MSALASLHRSSLWLLGVALLCPACGGESSPSTRNTKRAPAPTQASAPESSQPAAELPAWVLLSWETRLHTAPEELAPALTLMEPEELEPADGRGRVLRVAGPAGRDGQWWQLESVAELAPGVEGEPPEGFDVYAIDLYVPAGTGEPLTASEVEPAPSDTGESDAAPVEEAAWRLQSGQPRPPGLKLEWRVAADQPVFWLDGREAGTVRKPHAFAEAGTVRKISGRSLICFGVRLGPRLGDATELCFAAEAVKEATAPAGVFADRGAPEGARIEARGKRGLPNSEVGLLGQLLASEGTLDDVLVDELVSKGAVRGDGSGFDGVRGQDHFEGGGIGNISGGGAGTGKRHDGPVSGAEAAAVAIKLVKVTSSGPDEASVRAVVKRKLRAMYDCVPEGAGERAALVGRKVVISMTVESDGSTSAVTATGASSSIDVCFARALAVSSFAADAAGDVRVDLSLFASG